MISNQDIREEIIKELELGGLPPEAQDEIIAKFAENLLKKIAIAILDKLPSDKQSEFEALVNTGDTAQVYAFLQMQVPDAEGLMKAEMRSVIAEIKKLSGQANA